MAANQKSVTSRANRGRGRGSTLPTTTSGSSNPADSPKAPTPPKTSLNNSTNESAPSILPANDVQIAGQSAATSSNFNHTYPSNSVAKMIKHGYVSGFEECMKRIEELSDKTESLYVVFLGSKVGGRNWCPDCVIGEDLIAKAMEKMSSDAYVLYVDVGDRASWKQLDNPWRKDGRLKLTNIPTVIEWKKKLRLEGEQCLQLDIVQLFFGIE